MCLAAREILWKMVKEIFNENPQGIPLERITDQITIKPGFVSDNPHLIILDYVEGLRSAGFLKVVHRAVTEKFVRRIHVPIWRIPENITFTEVCNLVDQPVWMLWFMYPEGNII